MSARRVLVDQLISDEGHGPMQGGQHLPYLDCCGKYWRLCTCTTKGTLTIGYGTNLDVGLAPREVMDLLEHRIDEAVADLSGFPWFATEATGRWLAVANLRFNLGASGFRGFKRFLAAMARQDYPAAAAELVDSDWIGQVQRRRSDRIRRQILTGDI